MLVEIIESHNNPRYAWGNTVWINTDEVAVIRTMEPVNGQQPPAKYLIVMRVLTPERQDGPAEDRLPAWINRPLIITTNDISPLLNAKNVTYAVNVKDVFNTQLAESEKI